MINKPPPFTGLNIRIPIITPIKGREFINHGSGLPKSQVPNYWVFGASGQDATQALNPKLYATSTSPQHEGRIWVLGFRAARA